MPEVSESSLFGIGDLPKRQRGRPRAEPTEPVMTRIPLPLYDQITKTAHRRGESVASVVRSLLMIRVRRELL